MSKKTELIKILKDYKTKYEILRDEVSRINQSMDFTPEWKEHLKSGLFEEFDPFVTSHRDKAIEIIDKGMQILAGTWRNNSAGKLADGGYQAGLSNVIKMLELGTIQATEDLQNIVDTYKDDFNAMAVIKTVATEKGIDGVVFPVDNRERNRQLLNQLKENIDFYINIRRAKSDCNTSLETSDVVFGIDGMAEFVDTRLGDNLELLN